MKAFLKQFKPNHYYKVCDDQSNTTFFKFKPESKVEVLKVKQTNTSLLCIQNVEAILVNFKNTTTSEAYNSIDVYLDPDCKVVSATKTQFKMFWSLAYKTCEKVQT